MTHTVTVAVAAAAAALADEISHHLDTHTHRPVVIVNFYVFVFYKDIITTLVFHHHV